MIVQNNKAIIMIIIFFHDVLHKIVQSNEYTVKLGYNELGYNEHSVITNKNIYLVGLGQFYDIISRL